MNIPIIRCFANGKQHIQAGKEEEEQCGDGENWIKYPDDQWLKDIIMVLLLNEMYRRRQNRRSIIEKS